jgi:hypothetical protein
LPQANICPPKVKLAFEAYSKYFWGSPHKSKKLKTTCLKLQGNPFWNGMNVKIYSSTYITGKHVVISVESCPVAVVNWKIYSCFPSFSLITLSNGDLPA